MINSQDYLAESKKKYQLFSIAVISLCILLFSLLYTKGVSVRHNSIIPEPIGDYQESIAAVISNTSYGLKGYMYFPIVLNALRDNGMNDRGGYSATGKWVPYPENLKSSLILDGAIKKAQNLQFDTTNKSYTTVEICPLPYSDLGLVNYIKIAFRIFGYKTTSLYKFYFVLLGLVSFIFLVTFRSNGAFLLIIPLILYSLLISIDNLVGANLNFIPLQNYRYFELLALIPTAHLVLLGLQQKNTTSIEKTSVLLQSLLLTFIITCRCSVLWCAISIFSITVFTFVIRVANKKIKLNLTAVKAYASANKEIIAIFALPFILIKFVKHYKVLMFFCGVEGAKSIRQYNLFLHTFIFSILIVGIALFFAYKYFKLSLDHQIRRFFISPALNKLIFALAITSPIAYFFITEHRPFSIGFSAILYCICLTSVITACYCLWYIVMGIFLKFDIKVEKLLCRLNDLRSNVSLTFVLVLLFFRLSMNISYHPSYFSNEAQPHHLVYHNAFMALPLYKPYHDIIKNTTWGDELSFGYALDKFMNKKMKNKAQSTDPESKYNFAKRFYNRSGAYKPGLVDHYLKSAYFKLILSHPILFVKSLLAKLPAIMINIVNFTRQALGHEKLFLFSLPGIFMLFGLLKKSFHQSLKLVILVIFLLLPFSTLPAFYYLPSHTVDATRVLSFCLTIIVSAYLLNSIAQFTGYILKFLIVPWKRKLSS